MNNVYVKYKQARVEIFGRGFTWLDTGTPTALMEASNFVQAVERHGLKIACLEEIAWRSSWISDENLIESASRFQMTDYGQYLASIVSGK